MAHILVQQSSANLQLAKRMELINASDNI